MSSPKLEEEGVLREWAPLSKLLQQIPMRLRQGMFLEDVKFTCVDATIECIVLGTNCSSVFWYDRSNHYVQQLKLEKGSICVTSVKVVSTVDFMVAAGDNSGIVSIFRIPKNIDGNQSFFSNLGEKIERYTVDGLHKSKITALDWSINGQKLFSGDSEGVVVFTEMDFIMNLSKAREIVNETYSIVQLSYNQREQVLLISSELRSIIWRCQNSNTTIAQVGQRERPSLMALGGTFICDPSGDISVFSCRSGLKLWKAALDGSVKFTLLFKEALSRCKYSVKLLKPLESIEKPSKTCEFGKLFSWRDGLFVSYTKNNILIIDPTQVAVVSSLLNVKDIVCLCTTRTELFLVAGHRELIRLGYTPDLYDSSIGGLGNMAKAESVSSLPAVRLQPVVGSPLSTSYSRNISLSATAANSEASSTEVLYGREPGALPPVVSIQDGVAELRVEPSKYQRYTSIGQQGFDDIIYSQWRSEKHKSRRKSAELPKPKSKSIGLSFNGVATYINNIGKFLNGEFSPTICDGELEQKLETVIPKDILPDMRNLDEIVEDVARKEVLLDAILESSITFKDNESETDNSTNEISSIHGTSVESSTSNQVESISRRIFEIELERPEHIQIVSDHFDKAAARTSRELIESSVPCASVEVETVSMSKAEETSREEVEFADATHEQQSPPAEVSNVVFHDSFLSPIEEMSFKDEDFNILINSPVEFPTHLGFELDESSHHIWPITITESNFPGDWQSLSCPECPVFVSAWKNGLVMCSPSLKVYVSSEDGWSLLDYKAQLLIPSPCGSSAFKLHCALAHYSEKWKDGGEWIKVGREVQYGTVLGRKIWYISNGKLFSTEVHEGLTVPHKFAETLSKLYPFNCGLLVITENGRLFLYENEEWKSVRGIKNCKLLSVGPQQLVWVVDSDNSLFVTSNLKAGRPLWWQIPIRDLKEDISSICSTEDGVYIAFKNSSSIFFNKHFVTGHRWTPSKLSLECVQISPAGVFEDKGCIWILDKSNKLTALDSSLNILKEIIPPCNVTCIASAPEALWLLSDDGSVYLRQDITESNPVGIHWRKLNLEQLHSQVEMVSISCGPDVVWACDIRGKILMIVGSPCAIANDSFNQPAWVEVDGCPIDNNTFTKVYVGPDTFMVWALDNAGNVYVREAVFPTFPLGTGWVHLPDLKAAHLTISSEAVYALNREGVYKRIGISQSNYIGDAWLYFRVKLDYIAASFDLGLFGICSTRRTVVTHIEREFALSEHVTVEKDWALL